MDLPDFLSGVSVRAVAVGAAAFFVGTASAHAAGCPATPTSVAFAKVGDDANYSLAPGGDFETAAGGWTLGGALVVAGNEPLLLGAASDDHSLVIAGGTRVVSAPFCVGVEHPTFRFLARKTSGKGATLAVRLRWTQPNGQVNETTTATLNGSAYASWTPTPSLTLAPTLPLQGKGQSLQVQVVFETQDAGGAWQIDDLYIDPYRRS